MLTSRSSGVTSQRVRGNNSEGVETYKGEKLRGLWYYFGRVEKRGELRVSCTPLVVQLVRIK